MDAQTKLKKLIVVIPAHNEEATISTVIQKVPRQFRSDLQVEVLVVNDGSQDRTDEAARQAGADHILTFPNNRGLGAAIREGLRASYRLGADFAVMIDADDEYPAACIPDVLDPILQDQADYVLGSRFAMKVRGMRLYRRLGNIAFTWLQRILLRKKITDGQTGFRAFSRVVLRDFNIIHDYNYAQVLTLNIVRQGYRLAEVAIPYKVRQVGTSFITWRYIHRVLPAIFREMLRDSRGVSGTRRILDNPRSFLYDACNDHVEKLPS